MYDEFRIAILRIMYDIVNADGFIDDVEINALEEFKKKYGIVSNGQENTDLIARSNKISFGEAVSILRKWRDKENELMAEGFSGKYSTKTFWEDINHLARIDGDCSTDEAHLLLAIQYMLSGDEDEVKMISCKKRNLNFSKNEILYVESDWNEICNAELNRKERLKSISSTAKLYGFDFVYIPEVVSFLKEKFDQGLLSKIMMFANPLFLQNKSDAKRISEQLTTTTTADFVKYYLSEHGEIPEIAPSLMIKIKTSLKPSFGDDKQIQWEEYIDFLLISIDKNVSSTANSFLDDYIVLANRMRHPVVLYANSRIQCRGFHKTMMDYMVYRSLTPKVNKVVLDFSRKTKCIVFDGIGEECRLPPIQLFLYALIIIKSNSRYGCLMQRNEGADRKSLDAQQDEFRSISGNAKTDLYYNVSSYVSKIKRMLSEIIRLPNVELYLPESIRDGWRIKAPLDLFYVRDCGKEEIPISQWFDAKTKGRR